MGVGPAGFETAGFKPARPYHRDTHLNRLCEEAAGRLGDLAQFTNSLALFGSGGHPSSLILRNT